MVNKVEGETKMFKYHRLKIDSLHDAQAHCECEGWSYTFTGPNTREEIELEWEQHVRGDGRPNDIVVR